MLLLKEILKSPLSILAMSMSLLEGKVREEGQSTLNGWRDRSSG